MRPREAPHLHPGNVLAHLIYADARRPRNATGVPLCGHHCVTVIVIVLDFTLSAVFRHGRWVRETRTVYLPGLDRS